METRNKITFLIPDGSYVPQEPTDGSLQDFVVPGGVICRVDDTFLTESALEVREWLDTRVGDLRGMRDFTLLSNEPLTVRYGTARAAVGGFSDAAGRPRWVASVVKRFETGETVAFTAQWPNNDNAAQPDLRYLAVISDTAVLVPKSD